MREIKFKYYMQQEDTGYLTSMFYTLKEIESVWDTKDSFNRYFKETFPRYFVFARCEYTGLKDKNGKEIYEGDIISGTTSNGVSGASEVFWGVNCYQPFDYLECQPNELEIIGNIYENPELFRGAREMKIRMIRDVNIDYRDIVIDYKSTEGNQRFRINDVYTTDDDLARYFIKQDWAEEVKEPTYVPYKEPKGEWFMKTIRFIHGHDDYIICGIKYQRKNERWLIQTDCITKPDREWLTLETMFNHCTWSDGSPFGEVDNV